MPAPARRVGGRSLARRGLDLQRPVQQRYAIAHTQDPKPFGPGRGFEAGAVVSDAHRDSRLGGTVLVVLLLTYHELRHRGHQLEPREEPVAFQCR